MGFGGPLHEKRSKALALVSEAPCMKKGRKPWLCQSSNAGGGGGGGSSENPPKF